MNSLSLDFRPADEGEEEKEGGTIEKAYFAGGCFWGVEYHLQRMDGVISTRVGYMGGHKKRPSYKEGCKGRTGLAEALEVVFDSSRTSFEKLARLFFEIHDPTQRDRQGPDVGSQYRSAVFYVNDEQKQIAEKLVKLLEEKGLRVATKITPASRFWPAEDYHQDYYTKSGKQPYCHRYTKRF